MLLDACTKPNLDFASKFSRYSWIPHASGTRIQENWLQASRNRSEIEANGSTKAEFLPRSSKSHNLLKIYWFFDLRMGPQNQSNLLRTRSRKNNNVGTPNLMNFGAISGSKIDGKTSQLQESGFHEKPCFSFVKSMFFSLGTLRKSLNLQLETRTRNRLLRNSKFHGF